MPNPFTRQQRNVSEKPLQERSVEPVPEDYAGPEFPYRGIQPHGVDPTVDPTNVPGWVHYVDLDESREEKPSPDPIPVRIVSESTREISAWRAYTVALVDTTPSRVVNADSRRKSVQIRNDGPRSVLLRSDPSIGATDSYRLASGDSVTLSAETDVFATMESTSANSTVSGWVTLVPRSTYGPGSNIGPAVNISHDAENITIVLRVYSVGGASPSAVGYIYDIVPTSGGEALATIVNTGAVTAIVAGLPARVDTAFSNYVKGNIFISGADSSIDAELMAYIGGPTEDNSNNTVLSILVEYTSV